MLHYGFLSKLDLNSKSYPGYAGIQNTSLSSTGALPQLRVRMPDFILDNGFLIQIQN